MKSVLVMSVGVMLGLAACATTDVSETAALPATEVKAEAEAEVQVAEAEEELICRTEQVLGSRFSKRVCATQEKWTQMRDSAENTSQYMRRNIRSQNGQSGS